ncbi:MAG: GGDEF domain-containing protein [Oscillospiraceae bacterium]|nr:GGDEF domain-containing protein [Oscillospiraceae bacterium]
MIGSKKLIALCISRLNDYTCNEFIAAFGSRLAENNCALFVYGTCTDLYWNTMDESGEKTVFELIDYDRLDAMVFFDEKIKDKTVTNQLVQRSVEHNIPVICIDGQYDKCVNISFNYDSGFEKVVRHVIEEHKVRDVHFMGGIEGNDFSEVRLNCFKKVLEDNNIPFNEDMVSYGQFWSEPARMAAEKLVEENRVPKALICANDVMAITAATVFKKHGIRMPEDVIVTGFDGIEEIEFSVPKITSCKCSYTDMGERTAEIIGDIFDGKTAPEKIIIEPRMILSESCGCDMTERVNVSEHLTRVNNYFFRYQEDDRGLSRITAKLQICSNISDASTCLNKPEFIYDLHCILNLDAANESISPLAVPEGDPFSEKMCVFFDADNPVNFSPYIFDRHNIIPDLQPILDRGFPLIFCALNFINVPLGYICFHYRDYSINNYCKIPQTVTALSNAIGGFRNIRHQQYLNVKLEDMYKLDALTGLYNRRGFMREYKRMLELLPKDNRLTVILADLDGLKKINDNYGHREGDNAIHTVAQALKFACPEGICTRFGGDEMLGVIMDIKSEADIRNAVQEYLDSYNSRSEKPYTVSASVGIYVTGDTDSLDFEELIKKSDKLMYADKTAKKRARGELV